MNRRLMMSAAAAALCVTVAPGAFAAGQWRLRDRGIQHRAGQTGWREEMICAMRAQALVEPDVASLIGPRHRNTDSAGHLVGFLNNLIEAGVRRDRAEPVEPPTP